MDTLEKCVLRLETRPWSALYRIGLGFAAAFMTAGGRHERSGWALILAVLGVLFLVRFGLMVARRIVPFSEPVRKMWAEQRQLAKRHDSYQWRKLFWVGVGVGVWLFLSGRFTPMNFVICAIVTLSGAVGILRWRVVSSALRPAAR